MLDSLRLDRLDFTRLSNAFALSLLIHLVSFGVYQGGQYFGVWERIQLPDWTRTAKTIAAEILEEHEKGGAANVEPPLIFVDVNPAVASSEPPKDTPYYSDKNSVAADPEAFEDTDIPKIEGSQEEMVRTADVPPMKSMPLIPAPPPSQAEEEKPPEPEPVPEAEEAKPRGDLMLAKAEDTERQKPESKPTRPRTLKEAMARKPELAKAALSGRKMKQDGGVPRLSLASTLDVKASPFGAYDAAIIYAVQNQWYSLLDIRGFGRESSGKVVVEFRLNYDGRITDMKVLERTGNVDEMLSLLCQKAVMDPAPFARWPSDMRRMVGGDYREVKFTFYYN